MTDRRLREDVALIVLHHFDLTSPMSGARAAADRILSIPAIRDALNFHSACLSRLEQGDFYVTKDNLPSMREEAWK